MKIVTWSFVALMVGCGAAHASWQFTKWEMTEDQAASAAQKSGFALTRAENPKTAEGNFETFAFPYAVGGFKFEGHLGFNAAHKLSYVHLDLKEGNPNALLGELSTKYGKPDSQSPNAVGGIYVWRTKADQIDLAIIGDSGFVEYQPRASETSKGL